MGLWWHFPSSSAKPLIPAPSAFTCTCCVGCIINDSALASTISKCHQMKLPSPEKHMKNACLHSKINHYCNWLNDFGLSFLQLFLDPVTCWFVAIAFSAKDFFSFLIWKGTPVCELSRNKFPKPESWLMLMSVKYQWENTAQAGRQTGQNWTTGKEKMECFVESFKSKSLGVFSQEFFVCLF